MTLTEPTLSAVEGRLLAHRRLLAQLMIMLSQGDRSEIIDWLADRALPMDGQEDPGAVPTEGLGLELALADEYRELATLARTLQDRG